VFEAAQENVVELATHRHGCCVLQRCIDAATDTQRQSIVDCIVNASVVLIQDAFGNYVVQYVLDLNNNEVNARLAYIFIERIVELSKQKFSSNVIEKCL
jgi:pumilio RNA-binding family